MISRALPLALAWALGAPLSSQEPAHADSALICAGRVWTMAGAPIPDGCVAVADGRIVAVGPRSAFGDSMRATVDRPGGALIPGLIDAHTHLSLAGDPRRAGGEANERSRAVAPELDVLDGFDEFDAAVAHARSGGVTTAVVTPGSIGIVSGQAALLKVTAPPLARMILRAPAGVKATSWRPDTYDELDRWLAAARAAMTQPAANLTGRLAVGAALLRRELPLIVHGGYPEGEIEPVLAVADKYDLRLIVYHCESCDENYEELVARNIPVVVGPRILYWNRGHATNLASFLMSRGLLVAIASDASYSESKYLLDDAGLAMHYGLSADSALAAVTMNPARILGIDDRVGSIEPGKDADLVLLSGPLFAARTRVDEVMIAGRVWYAR